MEGQLPCSYQFAQVEVEDTVAIALAEHVEVGKESEKSMVLPGFSSSNQSCLFFFWEHIGTSLVVAAFMYFFLLYVRTTNCSGLALVLVDGLCISLFQ